MKKSLLLCLASASILHAATASDLMLWYASPARRAMTEALPIGNGVMGGLVFGGADKDRIVLNEISLWTGEEISTDDYNNMGSYQMVGDVFINLPSQGEVSDYRRDLDVGEALAHVSYKAGGATYRREYFCSHPAGVMVVRLTADKPGSYTGSIELSDSHQASVVAERNSLAASGALSNGMKYEAQMVVLNDGGSLEAKGSAIEFKGCNSITLVVGAGTDYSFDYQKKHRGEAPHARVTQQVEKAAAKSYGALKAGHVKDFQSFFNRVALDLGKSSPEQVALPTDARKVKAVDTFDPQLEELLFQYGRYLMISCSRLGGLPANLQGLWSDSNTPPWHSDYHANINIQMNYWPAEVANLAECHTTLFDLIQSQLEPWRKATAAARTFNTSSGEATKRGWAVRTSHGIHGDMAWKWDNTANAWYCQHFWEHYAFGGDKEYLRKVAYPVMKEVCQFWEDHLKKLPDGQLVVPKAWSPEHGPTEDGVSYSQQIVWDLFNNYVEAGDALGIDKEYRVKVAMMRDQLATPKIGSWGQLLEWLEEKHDPKLPELDTPNDHHRHTSHLFAVYPGRQISVAKTPELAAAAKKSLDARGIDAGSDVREWSFAWRTSLYARLHDGESAHTMVRQLFANRNTCLNLFGLHPPMQIDGNFGVTAGIAEMLVQSHEGEINLLPALPAAWQEGSVKGLRARDGCELDLTWKAGKLTGATLHSNLEKSFKVRYGDKVVSLNTKPGSNYRLDSQLGQVR